jgi:glycogen(starch) synthase
MKHLILCREYPPSPYPAGGIGTYVHHIARLLAEAGETVHVIGQLWAGAPDRVQHLIDGRLVVHRVSLDEPVPVAENTRDPVLATQTLDGLLRSDSPWQAFAWQAGLLAEAIVEQEHIDLVEAQEFEAPLYFFQLRRALGLGPAHRPACLVQLHSPTEFIFRHNGWDLGRADFLTTKRLEDYSIRAADALLCPSAYLARQAETHYDLDAGRINVIPLPIGDTPLVARDEAAWGNDTFCYVGRLEPRKGVLEFVDAAVEVAREHARVRFEFVGSDTSLSGTGGVSVGQVIKQRIPLELADRFVFHGPQPRERLPEILGTACAAVVPSRWENFPNTCVEAMCTGLPVVASPNGGMVEMVDDGRTGWLSQGSAPEDLALALRRALATPPAERATMGAAARKAVECLCDNTVTVQRHRALRAAIARAGADRSLALPRGLWGEADTSACAVASAAREVLASASGLDERARAHSRGLGIVVLTHETSSVALSLTLDSLAVQSRKPARVVLVAAPQAESSIEAQCRRARDAGWDVVSASSSAPSAMRNRGLETLRKGVRVRAVAFVEAGIRLAPDYVNACEQVFERCAAVGIVSAWHRCAGAEPSASTVFVRPCPAFPYQWLSNEAAFVPAIRTEALETACVYRTELGDGFESWDVLNAVLAAGWEGITYPAILSESAQAAVDDPVIANSPVHAAMRRALLARYPSLLAVHAPALIELVEAGPPWSGPRSRPRRAPRGGGLATAQVLTPRDILRAPLSEKLLVLRRAMADPGLALRWLAWHARRLRERARTPRASTHS